MNGLRKAFGNETRRIDSQPNLVGEKSRDKCEGLLRNDQIFLILGSTVYKKEKGELPRLKCFHNGKTLL